MFTMHIPQGGKTDVIRKVLEKINAAVRDAYPLPDFMTFIVEYPLDLVAHDGGLLADDQQRVEDQREAYT